MNLHLPLNDASNFSSIFSIRRSSSGFHLFCARTISQATRAASYAAYLGRVEVVLNTVETTPVRGQCGLAFSKLTSAHRVSSTPESVGKRLTLFRQAS